MVTVLPVRKDRGSPGYLCRMDGWVLDERTDRYQALIMLISLQLRLQWACLALLEGTTRDKRRKDWVILENFVCLLARERVDVAESRPNFVAFREGMVLEELLAHYSEHRTTHRGPSTLISSFCKVSTVGKTVHPTSS